MSQIPSDADRQHHELSLLARLESPEWAAWRNMVEARRQAYGQSVANEFLRAGNKPDYETLQYKRGYLAGQLDALDGPKVAAAKLERLLAASEPKDIP